MNARTKDALKTAPERTVPGPYGALKAKREMSYASHLERSMGLHRISLDFVERYGCMVQGGPFEGMLRYVRDALHSHATPKLLGCYEAELHPVIADVLTRRYDVILDIGCAEGYYAVGFAMRAQGVSVAAPILAFDIDRDARRLCRETARINGVEDRILVLGKCTIGRLRELVMGRSLIFCDCDGYEVELLNPEAVPALRGSDIIVELHDCLRPGLSDLVLPRFAESHEVTLIPAADRDHRAYPAVQFLPEEDRQRAVSEVRAGVMCWAFLTPKGPAAR